MYISPIFMVNLSLNGKNRNKIHLQKLSVFKRWNVAKQTTDGLMKSHVSSFHVIFSFVYTERVPAYQSCTTIYVENSWSKHFQTEPWFTPDVVLLRSDLRTKYSTIIINEFLHWLYTASHQI